jgi:LysM repeat protein
MIEPIPKYFKRFGYNIVTLIVFSGCMFFSLLGAAAPTFLDLRHELDNHETEIRIFDERLATQENIIDSLRQQLLETVQKNRELVKGNSSSFDARITNLETAVGNILTDLRQLQSHANESNKALSQHKQKLTDTNHQIESLHDSLKALLKDLQSDPSEPTNIYHVQNGDSLEKIARKNNISLKKLKELNDLVNDRIFIGQILKIASP